MSIETNNPGYIAAAAYEGDPANVDTPDVLHNEYERGIKSRILSQAAAAQLGFPYWTGAAGAPQANAQAMITTMEAGPLPAAGYILGGRHTPAIVTKPGVHLFVGGPGDYFNADDVPILEGLTYSLTAPGVNYIQGATILGQLLVTGTQASLVYADRCRVQHGGGPALLINGTNSITRVIGSHLYINGTGGNYAMQLANASSFDGQRGNCEFTGVNGNTCIDADVTAGGASISCVDARIGGRVRLQGNIGLTLRGGNLGNFAAPLVDQTGNTGVVTLNEVWLFGQAAVNMFTAPNSVNLYNCVPTSGIVNNESEVTISNAINGYTAGTPGDWTGSPPINIQEAIDRLAAATPGA